ncbi:hypothetical protein CHS0354_001175 [Potamilus streckersoni]|uniref:Opine dehydrogenase domain-containing protein n=1 Tax=Potamilus streckersoni TaxID=2493646 RepID=A0AAE0T749_9BIVA|nr:hypothetical protein CHS0354_001175 [Potamilus streckersoni]
MSNASPLRVCVCGGGNGAHMMAVLAASRPDTEVKVLTLFQDEAERWSKALEKGEMTIAYSKEDGKNQPDDHAKPAAVSKEASEVVPGSDIVLFIVPAFAHEEYLKAIAPYVNKKTVIVGLPGQPGFEFQCKNVNGQNMVEECTIMSFETLPWACRIKEFGQTVDCLGVKKYLAGSILHGKAVPRKPPLMSLQALLGPAPEIKQVKHFLEILLMSYSFVHPAILFGKWKDWDGKPVNSEPLFYQGIDEFTANLMTECSKEFLDVAHAIMAQRPNVDLNAVQDIYEWYLTYYKDDIEDPSSLLQAIRTNKSYKGLVHPMKKVKNKFEPIFQNRYLTEDIPMGLVVFKGVAQIVGHQTPNNDLLLEWGQKKIGKVYLVNGKLDGKDVAETRCPQRYGIETLDDLLNGKKMPPPIPVFEITGTEISDSA